MTNSKYSFHLKNINGLQRIWRALFFSLGGLRAAYKHEQAFRQEVWLFVLMFLMALFLPVSLLEKIALIGVLLLVMVVELLNSAVEVVIDRISYDHHELSKRAKDYGSAAVLLTLLLATLVWTAVLVKNFFL